MPKDMPRDVKSCTLEGVHGEVIVGLDSEVFDNVTEKFTRITKIIEDEKGNNIIIV